MGVTKTKTYPLKKQFVQQALTNQIYKFKLCPANLCLNQIGYCLTKQVPNLPIMLKAGILEMKTEKISVGTIKDICIFFSKEDNFHSNI